MSTADNSQISYIRLRAVQLGQRGRSEQPLPLAEWLHSTLIGSHGATGQRLGAAGQLPGCIRSVCEEKDTILVINSVVLQVNHKVS